MSADIPKQYLPLLGKTVIEHTLQRLGKHPRIKGVVVVLARKDQWWQDVQKTMEVPLLRADGGVERCHSVINGLYALVGQARPHDWILVHDAVRPCLRQEDIDRLMNELEDHPVGGLLGVRVRDTMKRTDASGEVKETVDRNNLWRALTPQMFRLDPLIMALRSCIQQGLLVTDEAQAMELNGAVPRLVEGHEDNIKITWPQDILLAELYLTRLIPCSSLCLASSDKKEITRWLRQP
jgi:2-C-methyl-D-erythritol 4-phosphate cytidylyltransferase